MPHGEGLRCHAAHRQADEVHRLAAPAVLPDQVGSVVGQRLDIKGAGHDFRLPVVAMVVTQHGVLMLQQFGQAVPHMEVTAERVAQHDDRSLTFEQRVQLGHGVYSLGVMTGAAAGASNPFSRRIPVAMPNAWLATGTPQ